MYYELYNPKKNFLFYIPNFTVLKNYTLQN